MKEKNIFIVRDSFGLHRYHILTEDDNYIYFKEKSLNDNNLRWNKNEKRIEENTFCGWWDVLIGGVGIRFIWRTSSKKKI